MVFVVIITTVVVAHIHPVLQNINRVLEVVVDDAFRTKGANSVP